VEAVPVAGTEATSGRTTKAAGNVLEAFGKAQDAIIEVAKSTAQMIDKAGSAARPDRVEVEFGLKFSASGTVIMAGVAGEASLKVTLGYDTGPRPRPDRPRSLAIGCGRRAGASGAAGGFIVVTAGGVARMGGCRSIRAGSSMVTANQWGRVFRSRPGCW
jgi:NTP-dependent ternary system trypsin peptidase co-occuring protein